MTFKRFYFWFLLAPFIASAAGWIFIYVSNPEARALKFEGQPTWVQVVWYACYLLLAIHLFLGPTILSWLLRKKNRGIITALNIILLFVGGLPGRSGAGDISIEGMWFRIDSLDDPEECGIPLLVP
jgi:hypothetical protein